MAGKTRTEEEARVRTRRLADRRQLGVTEAHLAVVAGPGAGRMVPCGLRPVRIGSAPDNDLVLDDSAVSRYHAVVEPHAGQLKLRDLSSRNGTFAGGARIGEALLSPGARFEVGETVLELRRDVARETPLPLYAGERFGLLTGRSPQMRELFTLLEWVAPSDATVLIHGPTGSGKDLVARSIHGASPRASRPMVVLDCGAIEPSLISSEIFGHEPGAFTGATARRAGVLEQAHGGTLFIDELGELPLEVQPRLLRVLESRQVKRLGGSATVAVDVRVVAATHRALPEMVSQGTFREDLYWRLAHVNVEVPPLEERREDIPLLVAAFVEALCHAGRALTIDKDAVLELAMASYPGNVRQLRAIVDRAALLARSGSIGPREVSLALENQPHLPKSVATRAAAVAAPEPPPEPLPPSPPAPGADTREALLAALEAHGFNLIRTARTLGLALNTLKVRMQRHGIPRPTARRTNG